MAKANSTVSTILPGSQFGRLTVIANANDAERPTAWSCQCECGDEKTVPAYQLKNGAVKSCGCLRRPNLIGKRFGRILVIGDAGSRKKSSGSSAVWECRCECGKVFERAGTHLRQGGPYASCGCSKRTTATHRMSHTVEHNTWNGMLERCRNPKQKSYARYGGRGIKVCERWLKFENFYADMGPRPSKKHSINRKDNDGNYTPQNCEWTVKKQQARNTSTNRFLTYKGRTQCVAAWAEEFGLGTHTIRDRLNAGWSVDRAISTPNNQGTKLIEFEGRTQTIAEWAKEAGISARRVWHRLDRGWSIQASLARPIRKQQLPPPITFEGRTQTISQWAKELGITYGGLYSRLKRGWSIERALTE